MILSKNHPHLIFVLLFERSGIIARYQWQLSFIGIYIADICALENVLSMTVGSFATI